MQMHQPVTHSNFVHFWYGLSFVIIFGFIALTCITYKNNTLHLKHSTSNREHITWLITQLLPNFIQICKQDFKVILKSLGGTLLFTNFNWLTAPTLMLMPPILPLSTNKTISEEIGPSYPNCPVFNNAFARSTQSADTRKRFMAHRLEERICF